MSQTHTHPNHLHKHGPGCGHLAVSHNGHTDYLHDGHLHHVQGNEVQECAILVNAKNPDACTPSHACAGHDRAHRHGPNCGHSAIPHGDHVDYLVEGHLHHPHKEHCDDHGAVA
jgi:hypothetical protein